MNKYAMPLKIASLVVAAVGYFLSEELQRREINEAVDEAIDKRIKQNQKAKPRLAE